MSEFSIETAREADVAVVSVAGDVDLSTVSALRHEASGALADPEVGQLVLDLAGLTFLDSTGLGCLVEIRQLAVATGRRLALRSVGAQTARVLELGGLDGFFDADTDAGAAPA